MAALLVGVIAGLGAWVFRMLIGAVHNLLFLGVLEPDYDTNQHTPDSPWGPLVILAPVVGAALVAWLVQTWAKEAKGHGVPEVMDAIHYREGRIRPVVALVKSLASAISIGSGGAVGREGPIIQIGSSFGSTLGQILKLPPRQCITLIAAGASSGIAATFNAPLGGIMFSIELLLVSVNSRNLLSVCLSTVTATFFGRWLLDLYPAFHIPEFQIDPFHLSSPVVLLLFFPFGLLMGLVATGFLRGIYWAEDRFDAMPGNYYTRHMSGMLLLGIMMYLLKEHAGHYYVQGVGYATIMDTLTGMLTDPLLLLMLFCLKFVATCLTLGSGGSGGIFSPSLFLGATAGALFGNLCLMVFPDLGVRPEVFVIAGMAAVVGGGTGAVLTAIIMLFEMTRDYNAILPVIISTAAAYGLRKRISPESIYTLKLMRRGHVVPEGLQTAVEESHKVGDLMQSDFRVLQADDHLTQYDGVTIVSDGEDLMGTVHHVAHPTPDSLKAGERLSTDYIVVPPSTGLLATLRQLTTVKASYVLVSDKPGSGKVTDIVGVLTAREIASAEAELAMLL